MAVSMPQELEVWYIIPAIRRELALRMREKGLTQKETAKKLFLTEPAVSQYLKSKRAKQVVFNEAMKKELDKAAENILKKPTKVNVIKQMQKVCKKARINQIVCDLHRKMDDTIKCGGCDCYESLS